LLKTVQLSSSRPVTVHTIRDDPHRAILDVADGFHSSNNAHSLD
jgi:hypothetical protein